MKENKKGISLIVLIITIIVVIILAAAVILSLNNNNPISSAKEATFKEDVRSFQDELAMSISKDYIGKQGQRDEKITTSDFDTMKKYIPSLTDKYNGMFKIENDELKFIWDDTTKKIYPKGDEWAKSIGITTIDSSSSADFDATEWDKNVTDDMKNCYIWSDDTKTELVGFNGTYITNVNKLVIPSTCKKIELDTGNDWYNKARFIGKNTNITSIELPEGLESIGDYAFEGLSNLTTINIPSSVTSITGTDVFNKCNNNLTINCKVSSKPSGWDDGWNSGKTVKWGV